MIQYITAKSRGKKSQGIKIHCGTKGKKPEVCVSNKQFKVNSSVGLNKTTSSTLLLQLWFGEKEEMKSSSLKML